jgi:hypothetical protein
MDDKHPARKGFDYQERWHGFGSPVGLGIGLVCIGATVLLISLAHYFWTR